MKTGALAALLLAAVGRGLAAQAGVAARLDARVAPEVVIAVRALADTAAGRGLPVEPLIQKALEGGAKRVPADRIIAGRITTMPTRNASSAAAPPDPNAIPIDVRISPAAAPPESRWNNQKPDTSVIRATIGRMTGRRRRISAAISFPPSGPASASAGIRKNVWNAIMPTHNAPKNTWAKRRMSITCDSLSS